MAHEILVSAQGPSILGFRVLGLRVLGLGLITRTLYLGVERESCKKEKDDQNKGIPEG